MTQPQVTITELDGALGVLPPSAGRLLALIGVSSSGPLDTPATFARVKDVQNTFGRGPLVEAAAHMIEAYGRPVLIVRAATASSPAPSVGAVTSSATGTSDVTVHAGAAPVDDFELVLKIVKGGTVGTAGITFVASLDGGRTFGPETALGTATTAAFPDSAGVSFDFDAGTLLAGDKFSARATGPVWDSTTLAPALSALAATAASWELVHVVGPIDSGAIDAIELAFGSMTGHGKYHAWIGNARIPNESESEATYLGALSTALGAKETKHGALCAGAVKLVSSVSGRQYRRPLSFSYACREASSSEEVNNAAPNLGALIGVSIRDRNGNADEHDESLNPGLDDARFVTARTIDGYQGVYINRPRLFSNPSSDFQLLPHRRVLNLAHDALRVYFTRRLNQPIIVSRATGFILEADALEIEHGALAVLRSVLLAKPKASDVQFRLSRTDNLLSTKTLTGEGRVIPLAYPEFIALDVGFYNPALIVQAA